MDWLPIESGEGGGENSGEVAHRKLPEVGGEKKRLELILLESR